MRRIILFAAASIAMIFCLALTASAEYHTYTATAEINADVQIPILVTAVPGTLDLGDLAPGVCRILGTPGTAETQPIGPSILFTVNGAYGWPFTVEVSDLQEHNENPACMTGKVTLETSWYNSPTNNASWVPGVTPSEASDPYFYLGNDANGDGIANHHAKCPENQVEPGGNYYFKFVVTKMTAEDDATVGTYRWEISLTASYACVLDVWAEGVASTHVGTVCPPPPPPPDGGEIGG